MSDSSTTSQTPVPSAPIFSIVPLPALSQALGDPLRWAILREMADGEPVMVVQLAKRLKRSDTVIGKHIAVLRKAGIVAVKQRLQYIPAHFVANPANRILDLGHCLLRLAPNT